MHYYIEGNELRGCYVIERDGFFQVVPCSAWIHKVLQTKEERISALRAIALVQGQRVVKGL